MPKLNFSQFHPLDHPIWDSYCRHVDDSFLHAPSGWINHRLHLKYWYDFMWTDPHLGKLEALKRLLLPGKR